MGKPVLITGRTGFSIFTASSALTVRVFNELNGRINHPPFIFNRNPLTVRLHPSIRTITVFEGNELHS